MDRASDCQGGRSAFAPARGRAREAVLVAALLIALTVVMVPAQVRHLDQVPEYGDVLFNIWRIAWVAHQLPRSPVHLYDANIFWPDRYTLAYSDGMPLTGIAAAPLIWLGIHPGIVCNVLIVTSFVLSGLFMYLFVRALVGRPLPAFVSGVAFAFYPYRFEHYIHLELLSAFWMPLALWALHRTIARGRLRDGLLTGAALAAQYLSSIYYGIFLACFMAVVAAILILRTEARKMAVAKSLAAGALVTIVLVGPSVWPHLQARRLLGDRTEEAVTFFSATPGDYLVPYAQSAAYRDSKGYGAAWDRKRFEGERQLFPGILLALLALVALLPPFSATRIAYLAGLVLAFEASLGSHGFLYPVLYEWVLPFRGLRAPARFGMVIGCGLAVLAGFGASRVLSAVKHRTLAIGITTALCAVILFEARPVLSLQPLPRVPRVYDWFKGRRPAPVVEVPTWLAPCDLYDYYSIVHWQWIGNGLSGALGPSYPALHRAMRKFPDAEAIAFLQGRSIAYVVVHEAIYGRDDYARMVERIARSGQLAEIYRTTDDGFESRIYKVARVQPPM